MGLTLKCAGLLAVGWRYASALFPYCQLAKARSHRPQVTARVIAQRSACSPYIRTWVIIRSTISAGEAPAESAMK